MGTETDAVRRGRCGVHVQRVKLHQSPIASRELPHLTVLFPIQTTRASGRRERTRALVTGGNATRRAPPPARRVPLLPASPLAARRRRCFRGGVRVGSATGEGGSGPGAGGGDGDGAAASWLSSAVGEKVDELLRREENRALLEGVEDAERRVERARAALADIERQEAAARLAREEVRRLEKRRDEIEESQRELLQAREMIDEAQRSLTSSLEEGSFGDVSSGDIDEDSERLESVKAAAVSSIVGVLASLPISFYEVQNLPQLFLQSSVVFISCALFGVTFRYAVRRDLDNIQLKTGAPAAFAFVRGLALLGSGRTLELSTDTLISVALDGAVSVVENIFIFLPAAVALDYCFKMRFLSPFPTRKQ